MPFFSIIIPVYNMEKFIDQCMESVLNQSYRDFEIILIDDGSTDHSLLRCEWYGRSYQNYVNVVQQNNLGLSAARNTGIEFSKGLYLIFLDSDDWLSENSLENLYKAINYDKHPEIMINRLELFHQNSGELAGCKFIFNNESLTNLSLEDKFSTILNYKDIVLTACNIVIRKDYLVKNELYFIQGILHEDMHWVPLCILKSSQIGFNNNYLFCYRIGRENSIMNTQNLKRIHDMIWIIQDLILKANNFPTKKKKLLELWCSLVFCAMQKNLNQYNCGKDDIKEIKKYTYVLKYNHKLDYFVLYVMNKTIGVKLTTKIISKHVMNT